MVFTVRCFKCGEKDVRLIMGGRSIIHARCHDCGANLLAEVMEFEQKVSGAGKNQPPPEEPATTSVDTSLEQETSSVVDDDSHPLQQS